MTQEDISTPGALLLATIDCIEEYGLDQLTTRMIAERAGANVASINYYYRSKEQLVEEALEMTSSHMLEDVLITIKDESLSFREALTDVLFYLIEGGRKWPGISTAHLYGVLIEKEYDSVGGRAILAAFDRLYQRAKDAFPDRDADYLRFLLADLFSVVTFNILAPGYFQLAESYRADREGNDRRLAEHYVQTFYAMLSET